MIGIAVFDHHEWWHASSGALRFLRKIELHGLQKHHCLVCSRSNSKIRLKGRALAPNDMATCRSLGVRRSKAEPFTGCCVCQAVIQQLLPLEGHPSRLAALINGGTQTTRAVNSETGSKRLRCFWGPFYGPIYKA